jgi:hypothetical protein
MCRSSSHKGTKTTGLGSMRGETRFHLVVLVLVLVLGFVALIELVALVLGFVALIALIALIALVLGFVALVVVLGFVAQTCHTA